MDDLFGVTQLVPKLDQESAGKDELNTNKRSKTSTSHQEVFEPAIESAERKGDGDD